MNRFKALQGLVMVMIAVAGLFLAGCSKGPEPPLGVHMRAGLTGGAVLILRNLSGTTGMSVSIVRNRADSGDLVMLKPSEEKEFGWLELGSNFSSGDVIELYVQGFGHGHYEIKLRDKQYHSEWVAN